MKQLFAFSLKLLLVFIISFPIHVYIQKELGFKPFDYLIIESYIANYVLVIVSFFALIRLQKKYASSLGFFFLGGFFLKLIVFFVFFRPIYETDSKIETVEFLAFFIPYATALTIETVCLVRILNRA